MSKPTAIRVRLVQNLVIVFASLGTLVVPVAIAANSTAAATPTTEAAAVEMKHYRNEQWRFELDVPKQWTVLPGAVQGGPNQLARFMSTESGNHLLVVSRHLLPPSQTPETIREQNQAGLAKKGATNFVQGETLIGTRRVLTLEYETTAPNGTTWYTRHYYVIQGPMGYQLAFGTSNKRAMFALYERMARSFTFEDL